VTYDPPAGANGTLLETVKIPAKDLEHTECDMQTEPPKKLENLINIPALVVTGEARFHTPYDYCTPEYLRQAGM
jgi:hypothetical protein